MQKGEWVTDIALLHATIGQLEAGMHTVCKNMAGILHAHHVIVKLLRESVKFTLANCVDLVDLSKIRQTHLDLARSRCSSVN